jgi:hypothetical protein
MSRPVGFLACLVVSLLAVVLPAKGSAPRAGFIENRGQLDAAVLYYSMVDGATIYFTREAIVFDLFETDSGAGTRRGGAIWFYLEQATEPGRIEAGDRLPGVYNFLHGDDPSRWLTQVPVYARLAYASPWPGVDLVFRPCQGGLEYRLEGGPATAPLPLDFRYAGAEAIEEIGPGLTRLVSGFGSLMDARPQGRDAWGTILVAGPTAQGSAQAPGEPGRDAALLTWSTYLGSSSPEYGYRVALDPQGRTVISGDTESPSFPTTPGAYDRIFEGEGEAFVTKFDEAGGDLAWSTFLGGSSMDHGDGGLLIDDAGDIFVAGRTSSPDFPNTPGAFDSSYNGFVDAYVARLDGSGGSLDWSTFLGGHVSEQAVAIELDAAGNPIVVGYTSSTDFPTTAGSYQSNLAGGLDVFVTKLKSSGSGLVWSTFVGGSSYDYAYDAALSPEGDVLIAGATSSSNFPTTEGAYDTSSNGAYDGFVSRLNAAGSALQWSTFLGGVDDDHLWTVECNALGEAFVAGETWSTNFPVTPGAFDERFNGGGTDACVAKLDPTGSSLVWSTFLGGSGYDLIETLAFDSAGHLVGAGSTQSDEFPATPNAYDETHNGNFDACLVILDSASSALLWGSYLGGSNVDYASDIVMNADDVATLAGTVVSTNFPTTLGAYDRTNNGGSDAFACRLDLRAAAASVQEPDPRGFAGTLRLPNPYVPGGRIECSLPAAASVDARIVDLLGRRVRTLGAGPRAAGRATWTWDGCDERGHRVGPGVYFLAVQADARAAGRSLLLVR